MNQNFHLETGFSTFLFHHISVKYFPIFTGANENQIMQQYFIFAENE